MGNPNPMTNNFPKKSLDLCIATINLKNNNKYKTIIVKPPTKPYSSIIMA
jgi:hypothetical protein